MVHRQLALRPLVRVRPPLAVDPSTKYSKSNDNVAWTDRRAKCLETKYRAKLCNTRVRSTALNILCSALSAKRGSSTLVDRHHPAVTRQPLTDTNTNRIVRSLVSFFLLSIETIVPWSHDPLKISVNGYETQKPLVTCGRVTRNDTRRVVNFAKGIRNQRKWFAANANFPAIA